MIGVRAMIGLEWGKYSMGRFSQAGRKEAFRSLSVTVILESTAPITGRCSHCNGVSRSKTLNGKGFLSLECTFCFRKAEPLGSLK